MISKDMRSKMMSAVRSQGTKIEVALSKSLWKLGYRYRKNDKSVFGKPDIKMKKLKIAIFVDGDFWHGKNWQERKNDHKSNREFWHKKIEKNISRDSIVNSKLAQEGWTVLRFWGSEVEKKLDECINKIVRVINEKHFKN